MLLEIGPGNMQSFATLDMGWLRLVGSLNYRSLLQNIVSFIGSFTKETYNFKEPTNRSHPIVSSLGRSRNKDRVVELA